MSVVLHEGVVTTPRNLDRRRRRSLPGDWPRGALIWAPGSDARERLAVVIGIGHTLRFAGNGREFPTEC